MAWKEPVKLGELTVGDWLESYRLVTSPAMDADGPLNPNTDEPVVRSVVPGPYPDWHYQALAMLRLLETVNKQRTQIVSLENRIRALEKTIPG